MLIKQPIQPFLSYLNSTEPSTMLFNHAIHNRHSTVLIKPSPSTYMDIDFIYIG